MRIVWNATHVVAIASRMPKLANPNQVAGYSFETTYLYFGSARRSFLKESGPIRESQSRIDVRVRQQFPMMLE